MPLTGFVITIWLAGIIGKIVLLSVLLRRGRVRHFPIFSALILEELLTSVAGLFVHAHFSNTAYRHWFWTTSIVDECLQLFVLYEIAAHVFAPTGKWADDVRRIIIVIGSASAAAAGLLSALANPATKDAIQTFILRSNFFSALLMSELFVCMVMLSSTVGLPWKTHAARIAQGLGAYSLGCVALGIAKMFYGLQRGSQHFDQLNHFRTLILVGCEIYWIVTLWAEAPVPTELPEAMRIQIYTLQRQVENDLIRIRSWRKN